MQWDHTAWIHPPAVEYMPWISGNVWQNHNGAANDKMSRQREGIGEPVVMDLSIESHVQNAVCRGSWCVRFSGSVFDCISFEHSSDNGWGHHTSQSRSTSCWWWIILINSLSFTVISPLLNGLVFVSVTKSILRSPYIPILKTNAVANEGTGTLRETLLSCP